MNRSFKVGDRVRVKVGASRRYGGAETVIVAGPINIGPSPDGKYPAGTGYEVDLPSYIPWRKGRPARFLASRLEPVYDGNEKVSWSDCVWKPRELRV